MDAVRRTIKKIYDFLGGMAPTQKLLIASLMVVMLMVLFLVSQYAAEPKLVPLLRGVSAAEQTAAAAALDRIGVDYKLVNGEPHVAPDHRAAVYAQLGQAGALPADASESFDDLVDKLSPWNTASQNEAILLGHRQRALEHTVGLMTNVQRAKVLIDVPKSQGFGTSYKEPTASVTLFMQGGGEVNQKFANAVASTVAGSISGLSVANVRIIDGTHNKFFAVREDDVAGGGDYLEMQVKNERVMHEKLAQFLSYIPDVRIAVTAIIDASAQHSESTLYRKEGDGTVSPVVSEEKTTTNTRQPGSAGEPGVNPNTGLNIAASGGPAGEMHSSEERSTQFDPHVGVEAVRTFEAAGKPLRMNVAIGVPREFIASIWSTENPDAADPPTNADLDSIARVQLDEIRSIVANQIITTAQTGDPAVDVHVAMIPVPSSYVSGVGGEAAAGGAGGTAGGGLLAAVFAGGMLKNLALGSLAAVSLLLMFMMVRKASKPGELPTAEELVGIPPALLSDDDEMVGEADDASPTLAGLELNDDEVREAKLVEQVDQLVSDEPENVVALINRWIDNSP